MANSSNRPTKLMLMRALIPSWRFFDVLEVVYHLHYRYGPTALSFGPFEQAFSEPVKRGFQTLFFNPEGNMRLSYHSVIESLVTINPDTINIESTVPYQLILRIVRSEIQKKQKDAINNLHFQFKITSTEPGTMPVKSEDLLISKAHPW